MSEVAISGLAKFFFATACLAIFVCLVLMADLRSKKMEKKRGAQLPVLVLIAITMANLALFNGLTFASAGALRLFHKNAALVYSLGLTAAFFWSNAICFISFVSCSQPRSCVILS